MRATWRRCGTVLDRLSRKLFFIEWSRSLRLQTLFAWDENEVDRRPSTAWLDGARGVAALQVYLFHFIVNGYGTVMRTYGSRPEDNHYHQFPLIRPIWSAGTVGICNFFMISGYALSVNNFSLMRQGRHDDLYRRLCSSTLRRWFRLWLPVMITAFPLVFVFQYWPYVGGYQPPRQSSLGEEFIYFVRHLDDMVQPLASMDNNGVGWKFNYLRQAWTIPLEFRGSMVCYLTIMLVSQMPRFRLRAAVIAFLAAYAMHHGVYKTSLFFAGMLLADWNLEQSYRHEMQTIFPLRQRGIIETTTDVNHGDNGEFQHENKSPVASASPFETRSLFNISVFFTGYYLSGMPPQSFQNSPYIPNPGYEFLYRLQPPEWLAVINPPMRWYQSLSACCLIYSISQSSFLRRILESRFCQWLGRLSFSFYLVHVQIIFMISGYLRYVFEFLTGGAEGLIAVRFVFELVVTTASTTVVAAFVWRYVDRPVIRFSRWVAEELQRR